MGYVNIARTSKGRSALSKTILATIQTLERRTLLSGQAPVAVADTFSMDEDQQISLHPGETSLFISGSGPKFNGANTYTEADGTFGVSGDSQSVNFSFDDGGDFNTGTHLQLYFAAPDGQQLAAGETFTDTRTEYSRTPDDPGLEVDSEDSFNDYSTGKFTVTQANFDSTGRVENFAADFDQDDGDPIGTIQYHYLPDGFKSGVLANDTDQESDPLTAKLVTKPTHGVLFFNDDGTFQYAPFANYNGTDSFTYVANDGTKDSAPAKVTIDITPVDDPPSFTISGGQSISEDSGAQTVKKFAQHISAGGPDESGQPLEFDIQNDTDPHLFTVEPSIDASTGTLTYTPRKGVSGFATIDVVLSQLGDDSTPVLQSETQEFTITINPVNHKPTANGDTFSTTVNTALVVQPLAPETSITLTDENGTQFFTRADGSFNANTGEPGVEIGYQPSDNNSPSLDLEFAVPGEEQLLPGDYDGDSSNTPGQNRLFVGQFNQSDDTQSGEFTVLRNVEDFQNPVYAGTFKVSSSSDPEATLTGTVKYNYAPAAGVLANDTDPDNDVLRAKLVTGPKHGTLKLNSDGSFTYTPDKNFSGTDQFTYHAFDGHANSSDATVKINVAGQAKASIGGALFADNNVNAKNDSGDFGFLGWQVYIDKNKNGVLDPGEVTATADGAGRYHFTNLAAGTYRVRAVGQDGWRRTTSKSYYDVTVSTGGSSTANNFGYTKTVQISGTVFNDANGNRIQDSGEKGMAGVKVYLDDGDGVFESYEDAYVKTDSAGNFTFDALEPGDFSLRVVLPDGYELKTPKSESFEISLSSGETSTGNLFGIKKGT